MTFGLGLMRLPPAAFWAMTPKEFLAAMRAVVPEPEAQIERGRLAELMQRFPDRQEAGGAATPPPAPPHKGEGSSLRPAANEENSIG
jgi:uncharacterized phage protein (TIGR02216 family)